MKIKLMSPKDVEEFVKIASSFDYDIDLQRGVVYIDAKSFLGVMSMAMKKEMNVVCQAKDQRLENMLSKFAVA